MSNEALDHTGELEDLGEELDHDVVEEDAEEQDLEIDSHAMNAHQEALQHDEAVHHDDAVIEIAPKNTKKKPKSANDKGVDMDYIGSKEESAETRSVASRAKLRSKMNDDVEAFLKKGGKIQEIEPNVMADPPRKPVSNYGSRPI